MTLTDLSWLTKGSYWPPAGEDQRIAMYAENRELRANSFDAIWKDYQRLMREDSKSEFKIILGYFKLSTKKTLDTLLGKQPLISGSNEPAISELIESTDLYQADYEVALDVDSLGDGFFKIYRDAEGRSVIQSNDPSNVYVVVEPGNLRRVRYYVIANKIKKVLPGSKEEKQFLKVEIHGKNDQRKHVIEYRVYGLDTPITGKEQIGDIQDLGLFVDDIPALKEYPRGIVDNPVNDFLVIHVPGPRGSADVYGESSYGPDLKSLWKAIVRRYTGIDSVLTKHEDPNLIAPIGYATKDPVTQKQSFVGGGRVFQYRHDPGMSAPDIHYLTWDGNLNPSEVSIERLQADFWNAAEVPESILAGKSEGGIASGIAYRLMMTPLITKANRMEMSLRPRLQKAVKLALKLQGTPVEDVAVKFRDSLPKIPLEEAQRVATLATSGIFAGEAGTQYLLEEAGVPADKAAKIAKESGNQQAGMF
jgi:hypothetical protein